MLQHSGFENRHIDVYNFSEEIASDSIVGNITLYAPVFKQNDSITTFFPGTNVLPISSAGLKGSELPFSSWGLPFLFLAVLVVFVFLKNALKSSVSNIFLIGTFPKTMQETERRQIERNKLIINMMNFVSFFLITLIIYAFIIRFQNPSSFFEDIGLPKNIFYLIFFLTITGLVYAFFYLKNLIIKFFGNIFSASKMIKEYQKPFKMFFSSMIPVFFPIAVFIAFAPYYFAETASIYLMAGIFFLYVIYIVFSLIRISKNNGFSSIHIFLYLCTLEILPLLLIVKFLERVYF